MTPAEPAARCSRLVRIYPSAGGETHALRGIDASFGAGQVVAVTGPSGSGKSSLLSVLALRERQSGGELWIGGAETSGLGRSALRRLRRTGVGWVPERPGHGLFGHLTAGEGVEAAARLRGADRGAVLATLERLELPARGPRAATLSGGEQQRLAVATALAGSPSLVVADEPTAELDDASARLVLGEFRRTAAAGAAVVLATHDARAVATADRVLMMRHGVLSGEASAGGGTTARIDSTGRVQLPPEALGLFPDGLATVVVDADGVRLRPPDGTP